MRKFTLIAIAMLAFVLTAVPAAPAKGGDGVLRSGTCSAGSTWKLKVKSDDGRIETEFEVDQNRVGRRWRVTLVRSGSTVFRGIRTTVAPSGSFEVRRLLASGGTRVAATATAMRGGETCRAAVSF